LSVASAATEELGVQRKISWPNNYLFKKLISKYPATEISV